MSKTTRKTYTPTFKMAVATDVLRGDKTLSEVAAAHGVSPSLACERRDQLLDSADAVYGRAGLERERRRQEEATREEHERAKATIGQLTLERDFLRRFCDDHGLGVPPQGGGLR